MHVVPQWIGNSQLIAAKHYLQVTDEHFERAAQNAAQSLHEPCTQSRTDIQTSYQENRVFRHETADCELVQVGTNPTHYPREDSNL